MSKKVSALAVIVLLGVPAQAGAHKTAPRLPFLSIPRAHRALEEPNVTITDDCNRVERNVVDCWVEYEGALKGVELGSGWHARILEAAVLCGRVLMVYPGGPPEHCPRRHLRR